MGSARLPEVEDEIVYSLWRHKVVRYDGDMVFLTDNDVLVRKHVELPAIICAQKKAPKVVPKEEDFVTADINAFGNEIGSITNRATSMFEVRSAFEKGSKEYEMLTYRIRSCQLLQQDAMT